MKLAEIENKFQNEWVLIEFTELDDELNVLEGEVVAHSPHKEEIYAAMRHFDGGDVALKYVGEYQGDVAVMF